MINKSIRSSAPDVQKEHSNDGGYIAKSARLRLNEHSNEIKKEKEDKVLKAKHKMMNVYMQTPYKVKSINEIRNIKKDTVN